MKELSRSDRIALLDEACRSSWVLAFLKQYEGRDPKTLVHWARVTIFQYLRERYLYTFREQGSRVEAIEKVLREVSEEAVLVKPQHRPGGLCLVGRWMLSPLGDTYDGEYELVAG